MTTDSPYGWGGQVPAQAGFEQLRAPVQFDAELGQIFIQMRTLMGLSLWDMARAVGGEPPVVANLEAGAISALPPWPELTRLIDAYAGLTGIDPQPITARFVRAMGGVHPLAAAPVQGRMLNNLAPPANAMRPGYPASSYNGREAPYAGPAAQASGQHITQPAAPRPAVTQRRLSQSPALAAPAEIVETTTRPVSFRVRRAAVSMGRGIGRGVGRALRQWSLVLIVLVALPAVFAITCRLAPGVVYAAISSLPGPVYRPLRLGVDHAVALVAPVRDGLTWIDVGDPQIRKGERLPSKPAVTKR